MGLLGLSLTKWLYFAASYSSLGAMFTIVAGIGYLGTWIAARWVGPSTVRFGDITAFRDLAEIIADEKPHGLGAIACR